MWSKTLFDLFEIYNISYYVNIDSKWINTEYFLYCCEYFFLLKDSKKQSELDETRG